MGRHSKFKNTGILFELLTRQIAVDVINSKNKSKALDIVKEFFNKETELYRELELYQTVLREKFNSEDKANFFIDAVIKYRNKLNESKIKKQKYELIKAIKEAYEVNDFFRSRINNYRALASIYKIFDSNEFKPAELVTSRYSLIEHITRKPASEKSIGSKIVEAYEKQEKDLRLLSYKILVDKFNEKYSKLSPKQRKLLREYINNISNTNSLKEYIVAEIPKIKKQINRFLPKIDDKVTKIKLKEVNNLLDSVGKSKIVKDKQVISLMRYYELVKELKNVVK